MASLQGSLYFFYCRVKEDPPDSRKSPLPPLFAKEQEGEGLTKSPVKGLPHRRGGAGFSSKLQAPRGRDALYSCFLDRGEVPLPPCSLGLAWFFVPCLLCWIFWQGVWAAMAAPERKVSLTSQALSLQEAKAPSPPFITKGKGYFTISCSYFSLFPSSVASLRVFAEGGVPAMAADKEGRPSPSKPLAYRGANGPWEGSFERTQSVLQNLASVLACSFSFCLPARFCARGGPGHDGRWKRSTLTFKSCDYRGVKKALRSSLEGEWTPLPSCVVVFNKTSLVFLFYATLSSGGGCTSVRGPSQKALQRRPECLRASEISFLLLPKVAGTGEQG